MGRGHDLGVDRSPDKYPIMPSITVSTKIYTDSAARNWLAIHGCSLTPTKLGNMEISFASTRQQLEFLLKFGEYHAVDMVSKAS